MQLGKLSRFVDFEQLVQICENRAHFFRLTSGQRPLASVVLGRSQPWAGVIPKSGNIGKPDPNNQNIPTLASDTFRTWTHDSALWHRRWASRETNVLKTAKSSGLDPHIPA
jgi:hypothetical protein